MDSKLLNEILGICMPIIVAMFVPFLYAVVKHYLQLANQTLETRYAKEWDEVKSIVVEAVRYAEQKGLTQAAATAGAEKLQLATAFVEQVLAARGIDIALYPIVKLIEASVMEEFGKDKVLATQIAAATTSAPIDVLIKPASPIEIVAVPAKV